MGKDEIIKMTACALSSSLHKREISAEETARAFISYIEEKNGTLNAFITKTSAEAIKQAEKADRMLLSDKDAHFLCGIPYSIKDNFATRGIKTTCASAMLEDFVPDYNSTVFDKLTSCGSIILGKTNMDEFAMGSGSENSYFGDVRNPLDISRSAGGSSGGSAATVASFMSPFSIGSDTGGSSREPASFCGLVSMKPTYGLVSRFGLTEFASSFDTVCPITRGVLDNANILSAIAGRDPRDMTSLDASEDFLSEIEAGIGGVRIGFAYDVLDTCEESVRKSAERAALAAEKLGGKLTTVKLPEPLDLLELYLGMTSAEAASNLARYDGIKYGMSSPGEDYREIMRNTRTAGFGSEVKRRIIAGDFILSKTGGEKNFGKMQSERMKIISDIRAVFETVDIILMPTVSKTAFKLKKEGGAGEERYGSDSFTVLANLTGCPEITLPAGGDGQMPCGISLMGKKLSEKLLYKAALALEAELSCYVKNETTLYDVYNTI